MIDDVCVIKSMYTEAINHDPAATLFNTGSVIAGRPSMGAWVNYGLGTENANLRVVVDAHDRRPAGVLLDREDHPTFALVGPLEAAARIRAVVERVEHLARDVALLVVGAP